MPSLVAIDIETTGLDSQSDAIMEIGAVRFSGHRVEDEWSTLINPGRHIPEGISQLTGIDDAMVRQAPRLRDVLPELADFVDTMPVVGHSVRFDLGFLQKAGVLTHNPVVDTYELASVLLPSASRYSLGALGQQLAIMLPATHRALDDARVTQGVYLRLWDLAAQLPLDLLAEITRMGEPLDWDGNWVFQQLMRARAREGVTAKKIGAAQRAPALRPSRRDDAPPLRPVEDTVVPLDVEEVAAVLEYGGPFSGHFESYEYRPEQVAMLRAVTSALSDGYHLMVEAGTGVGKSFAYLVPAAFFSMLNNTRVVISTNTINLQDQLIQKDIPALRDALGIDLRASVLKGRSNYLCPRRLDALRHNGPRDADEMRVLAKVLIWQLGDSSGDRTGLNLTRPAERDAWTRISAEDDACTTENCLRRTGGACPFYQAKQSSQTSHILIVNHALLLSDVSTGSKVLPEYQYVIVDEAHHLESAVTSAPVSADQFDLERLLRESVPQARECSVTCRDPGFAPSVRRVRAARPSRRGPCLPSPELRPGLLLFAGGVRHLSAPGQAHQSVRLSGAHPAFFAHVVRLGPGRDQLADCRRDLAPAAELHRGYLQGGHRPLRKWDGPARGPPGQYQHPVPASG
jgi:DNA polymerase-3 subunit epsilon/ATP-dependent DNA helicase DinG